MKNNLIIDIEERLVRYLSRTFAGRIHDKRICDEEDYTFPPGCVLFKDTGFQGFEPDNVSTYQPKKKPRGQELSPEDKAENTMIASIRILVDHAIAGVKRCRIVHEVYRAVDWLIHLGAYRRWRHRRRRRKSKRPTDCVPHVLQYESRAFD